MSKRGPLAAAVRVSLPQLFIELTTGTATSPTHRHGGGENNMEQRLFHFFNVGHSAEIVFLCLFICGRTATEGNTRSAPETCCVAFMTRRRPLCSLVNINGLIARGARVNVNIRNANDKCN